MITDLFPPSLLVQLDKLSQFFVWRRKPLLDSIIKALKAADARHDVMAQAHQSALAHLKALELAHAQLTEQQATITAELNSTRQALLDAKHLLEQSQLKHRHDQEQAKLHFNALSICHGELVQKHNSVETARQNLEQQLEQTRQELYDRTQALENLQQVHTHQLVRLEHAQSSLDDLNIRYIKLKQEHEEQDKTRQALEKTLEQTRLDLLSSTETSELLQKDLAQHQHSHSELTKNFQTLQQHHGDTWTRFQLVSRLLAARPRDNAGLARFRELLATDYMAFAEGESSLAAEAKALTLLQSIEQELALLVSFPDVRKRTIVGIVGGFSSGKSEFINSFIHDGQVRLAVGLNPVTAIPSYVLATDQRMIRGYSANGGHIDLDVDFFKNISHAFLSSFSFDLKILMPFMCVGVKMKPECFSNICFIDTPGYNPPPTAGEHSQGDRRTAIQFSQQADAIIWLIALDTNGIVPDSDLEFIQQIGVEGCSVYVVLTKADLKAEDEIEDILEDVRKCLDDEDIKIDGISAYSSVQRKEITYYKVPLLEHFANINRSGNVQKHLEKRLDEVFSMYDQAIQADIAALHAQKVAINGLLLDCLEIGGEEVFGRMHGRTEKLALKFDTAPLETWLKESRRLHEAFCAAIQQTAETLQEE